MRASASDVDATYAMMTKPVEAPIELIVEDDLLIPLDWREVEFASGEAGVAARRSDGTWSLHVLNMRPTEREFYGLNLPEGIPYLEKRSLVIECAGFEPDELPWVQYDRHGEPLPESDCDAALEKWLAEVVSGERMDFWGGGRNSQYGVALDILDRLPAEECRALGLYRADLGGPASSVPAVHMAGSPARFNWSMRIHRLPFVLVAQDC